MSELARYAVFGLLDKPTASSVRALQQQLARRSGNGVALHFPVHITVRGRFLSEPQHAVSAFHRLMGQEALSQASMVLSGPVFRLPDLVWLEICSGASSCAELATLHAKADAIFRQEMRHDEVMPEHAGENYCPHVTLGWGCSEADLATTPGLESKVKLVATLTSLALVAYPAMWPVREDLVVVEAHDLEPRCA